MQTEGGIQHAGAMAARVSAVVVSYHTGPVLFECLEALRGDPAIAEIVVVNNGNPPETRARLEAMSDGRLKLAGEGRNIGFASGVNLGAASTSGERLLVINPDAILQPGSIEALERARAGASEPAIVGGRIVGADGREQRGGRRRRLTLATLFGGLNLNEQPQPVAPIAVGAVSGALMYMSRAGFDALGGFDAGYFLHVEDLDICRRAEIAGGSVIYTPHAWALHHGGTSDAPRHEVERHKAAGFARYFRKFASGPHEKLAAMLMAPLFGVALALRAALRSR